MSIAGIDLGTTNSSVAVWSGSGIRVFKDPLLGVEYTPSAVYMNAEKNLVVGHEARNRVFTDPKNAIFEFKRNMGTDSPFTFERTGLVMQPDELSAEVLKALNANVVRSGGKPITCAVITVPADFDKPQWDATNRAAALAGIKNCLLLAEPVAAAQAYSYSSEDDKTFWLVYDIGGGTFDAAIIQVRDGIIDVVEHKGNNRLGGSDIDVALLRELLIPALPAPFTEEEIEQIRDRNVKWSGVWAKLKGAAETAKIALSNPDATSSDIYFEYLCRHPSGEAVEYSYKLQRADLERLATPVIRKTINLVKEVLTAARLDPADIGKLVLVGGPTMMPLVRTMLRELQIELDYSVDPLTVVAQGAAISAAGKFVGEDDIPDSVEGGFAVRLNYQPVTPETDPEIAGTFTAYGNVPTDFAGYSVEFVNESAQPMWRSGKVSIGTNGGFLTTLDAQKGVANRFTIQLCDPRGGILAVEPAFFEIVVKGAGIIGDTVHNHDIGVELANDEVLVFYQKGQPLPYTSEPKMLRTTVTVERGASDNVVCVPVCEGERMRASRNRRIGELIISPEAVDMDVPAGSPIEVVLEVDANLVIRAIGRIPLLGRAFTRELEGKSDTPDPRRLKADAQLATDRLAKLRARGEKSNDANAILLLRRIDEERMISEIGQLVAAAVNEPGAGRQCINVLNRLNSSLDDLEDVLEWPTLAAEATEKLNTTRKVVTTDDYAKDTDRRVFEMIEREVNDAIRHQSTDALKRGIAALDILKSEVFTRDPVAWVNSLKKLKLKRDQATDTGQADRLISQGESAVRNNDVSGIQQAVRGLWALLPDEESEASADGRPKSTITA